MIQCTNTQISALYGDRDFKQRKKIMLSKPFANNHAKDVTKNSYVLDNYLNSASVQSGKVQHNRTVGIYVE